MKKVTLFICCLLFVFIVNAQDRLASFYIGPELSVPVGDFSKLAGIGYGGEIQGDIPLSKHLEGFGQAGFQSFSAKSINGVSQNAFASPSVMLGTRYICHKLNVGLGVGYVSYVNKSYNDGAIISPQIGLRIKKINLIAHYTLTFVSGAETGSNHFNFFGIKLFYRIANIFN